MRAEELFEAESKLRAAALVYAAAKTDETRAKLRAAAIEYADLANELDQLELPQGEP